MKQRCQKLETIFEKMLGRQKLVAFSKLMVYDQQLSSDQRVRHYDIECEAVQNIVSGLDTKIKTLYLRFFILMKEPSQTHQGTKENHVRNLSFSKISGNAVSTVHQSRNYSLSNTEPNKFVGNRSEIVTTEFQEIDSSIQTLKQKMKRMNQRVRLRNRDQNVKQASSENIKMQKRRLILSKLNRLQNELENLLEEESASLYRCPSSNLHLPLTNGLSKDASRLTFNESYAVKW